MNNSHINKEDINDWKSLAHTVSSYTLSNTPNKYDTVNSIPIESWTGTNIYGYEYIFHKDNQIDESFITDKLNDGNKDIGKNIPDEQFTIAKVKLKQNPLHPLPLNNKHEGFFLDKLRNQNFNCTLVYQVVCKPSTNHKDVRLPISKLYQVKPFYEVSEKYRQRNNPSHIISSYNDNKFINLLNRFIDYSDSFDSSIDWSNVADNVEEKANKKCYEVNIRFVAFGEEDVVSKCLERVEKLLQENTTSSIQGLELVNPIDSYLEFCKTYACVFDNTKDIEFKYPIQTPVIMTEDSLKTLVINND